MNRSAVGLAATAVSLVALWAALHALGLRESVSALSGTAENAGGGAHGEVAAAVYVLAWLGAVAIAPIFAIASAILAVDSVIRMKET